MNILLLTAHFPSYDHPNKTYATPFLFDYALEWQKSGHKVYIVHYARKYPLLFRIFSKVLSFFGDKRFAKFDVNLGAIKSNEYCFENIKIFRKLFTKFIPHKKSLAPTIKRLKRYTLNVLNREIGNVDVIIGDCLDPVLQIMRLFKSCNCKKSIIIHNSDIRMIENKSFNKKDFAFIDYLLLRSIKQKKELEKYGFNNQFKYMFSGVSKKQINQNPVFKTKIENLLYVGALYKSKGLLTIIEALRLTNNANLKLTIVGDGLDRRFFEETIKKYNLVSRITFVGKVDHNLVFEYMMHSDALVLISKETFGMVYVEAMSQACIPIGAKCQGIDGVVLNEKNGFLTELGNEVQLAHLFDRFLLMDGTTINNISKSAYKTSLTLENGYLSQQLLKEIE